MRVMFMIKGDPDSGAVPSEELLVAMGRYNDELKKAGVLSTSLGFSRVPRGGVSGSPAGAAWSSMGRSMS